MQVSISNIIYEGQHFMKLFPSAGSEFFQSSHVTFSEPWGNPEVGLRGFFNTLFTYFKGGKIPMSEAQCHDGLCEAPQDQHWILSRNGHLSSPYHKELYTEDIAVGVGSNPTWSRG